MHPSFRVIAAAALMVGLAGLGGAFLVRTNDAVPTSTAGPGPLPAALQSEWRPVGTREHPQRAGRPSGACGACLPVSDTFPSDLDIVIDSTTITIYEWHGDVLNAASFVGPDRLDLRARNIGKYWDCQIGDAGTYAFDVSAGGNELTLTPVGDACVDRATILQGDWIRTGIGDLAAGRHVSPLFKPLAGGTAGQFSYVVPDSWAEIAENETSLSLWKAPEGQPAITLYSSVVPRSHTEACAETAAAVGGTARVVAQWLTTIQGLVVTAPVAMRIGGLDGVMVDLSVRDGSVTSCGNAYIETFIPKPSSDRESQGFVVVGNERRTRYYLLDTGRGSILLVELVAQDQATWDASVADLLPIIDSFEFTR